MVDNPFPLFFLISLDTRLLPPNLLIMTLNLIAAYLQLNVSSLFVSFLSSLFRIILQTFGAVTDDLTLSSLFCCSPFSLYRSRWSTADVPFVCSEFGLLQLLPKQLFLDLIKLQNLLYSLELRDTHFPFVLFLPAFNFTWVFVQFLATFWPDSDQGSLPNM